MRTKVEIVAAIKCRIAEVEKKTFGHGVFTDLERTLVVRELSRVLKFIEGKKK